MPNEGAEETDPDTPDQAAFQPVGAWRRCQCRCEQRTCCRKRCWNPLRICNYGLRQGLNESLAVCGVNGTQTEYG